MSGCVTALCSSIVFATVVFATVLGTAPPAPPAPPLFVTGLCYTSQIGKPVAGALVTLYGPDDLLQSYTYSTDAGAFTLPAPVTPGRFYVVVTSGSKSERVNFPFQPRKPLRTIHVVFESSFLDWLKFVWAGITPIV